MVAAKLLIDVIVGLAPDMPIPERCRQWSYTSIDYSNDKALHEHEVTRFDTMVTEAMDYARGQMNPAANNYVRLDWIWL